MHQEEGQEEVHEAVRGEVHEGGQGEVQEVLEDEDEVELLVVEVEAEESQYLTVQE